MIKAGRKVLAIIVQWEIPSDKAERTFPFRERTLACAQIRVEGDPTILLNTQQGLYCLVVRLWIPDDKLTHSAIGRPPSLPTIDGEAPHVPQGLLAFPVLECCHIVAEKSEEPADSCSFWSAVLIA